VIRLAIEPPFIAAQLCSVAFNDRGASMRGILLWALGIPIPIIILLYLFHVI
jgi:hypothetical protein